MVDNMATKINLDAGIIKNLELKEFKNVLVLTGSYYSPKVFHDLIKPSHPEIKFHVYSKIALPAATDAMIYSITSFARNKNIDCILSVGSSAVMDAGRLVSLLLSHGGLLHEYLPGGTIGPLGITPNLVPHITVPTISGEGAEISGSASFIMNREMKTIISSCLVPKATYIDPELMRGIPDKLWATICFECFEAALSAYVSAYANQTSDSFAEEALKGFIKYSQLLLSDTNNIEYLKQIEVASINAFLAASFSSTGAVHAIGDVISAKFNLRQGVALAMVSGEVHSRNYEFNKAKYDKSIKILGDEGLGIKQVIDNVILKLGFNIPSIKEKLGKVDVAVLARECINYKMRGSFKLITPLEVEEILRKLP